MVDGSSSMKTTVAVAVPVQSIITLCPVYTGIRLTSKSWASYPVSRRGGGEVWQVTPYLRRGLVVTCAAKRR